MGTSAGLPLLQASLEKYDIRWALLSVNDPRIPYFNAMGWNRAYADPYAVIYTRPR